MNPKLTPEAVKKLEREAQADLKQAQTQQELERVRVRFLGRKGELAWLFDALRTLASEERRRMGEMLNILKRELEELLQERQRSLGMVTTRGAVRFDITRPGIPIVRGHLHPLTKVRDEIESIFTSLGFSSIEGPEIENEWYNFDALNIPQDHPAREAWDTLWLKPSANSKWQIANSKLDKSRHKLLLRTHTSPVQIRYMQRNQPPFRIISIGRVFRHEATDASHEIQFYQVEGLMVGKKVSVADFRTVIGIFLKRFFKGAIQWRMRPSYYPFVEPGFDIDLRCTVCGGKGCPTCGGDGWLEMLGAGMVHPNVFKNAGYRPDEWQGFAFGFGLDRFMMMRYRVDDVRLSYSGDLRFLSQF